MYRFRPTEYEAMNDEYITLLDPIRLVYLRIVRWGGEG